MAEFVCYTCKELKDINCFNKHNKYRSGHNNHCRDCVNLKIKNSISDMRDKQYLELSKYKCCACGFDNKYAKEVHHLATSYKRYGRSQDIRYNLQDVSLGTAVVLCSTCHSIFHGIHGGKNKKFPEYTKQETIDLIMNERNKT